MASKKSKDEPKVNKQFILDHLDEKEIDLSMCNLSQVPVKELAMVPRGTRLDLSRNLFTVLPDNFGDLKHLIELDMSNNQLTQLPDSIGQLAILQKLDLYSNKLTMLPLTFWQLKKLKWLDLRNNTLDTGLSEVAGPCVSEAECKQCASKVLVFMKQKSAESERKRQLELQQKRELEKKLADEESLKQAEAKRQKLELRQRKRDEHNRLEAEKAQLAKQQEQEEEAEFVKNEKAMGEQITTDVKIKRTSCGSFLSKSFALIVLLLLLGSVSVFVYCDYMDGPTQVCSYWKEYVSRKRWVEQLMEFIGYS